MRISTFNVENLFSRASAMNLGTWAAGRTILNDIEALNSLLAQATYTPAIKSKIKKLLDKYDFSNPNKRNRPFEIVQVRGKLFVNRKGSSGVEVTASGRADWAGWIELDRDDIRGEAINNTGRVLAEVKADVQCVVEVENRIALDRFNEQILSQTFHSAFEHNLLVDGRDPRGIDIGLLSRHPIVSVRSHFDAGGDRPIFSRDCPEFEIMLPDGSFLWLLGNHFKSKGYGNPAQSDSKRKRQAEKVAQIYNEARKRSNYIVVAGDLNDSPDSAPLQPLIGGTDLKEVMTHPTYQGLPGTYGTSKSLKQKFDYILLSPALWERVKSVGVERRGVYAPRAGAHFDTVTSSANAASDHGAVWVDIDL